MLGNAVGNYAIDAHASRQIKNNNISVQFMQSLQDAPYIMQQYASNFYNWNNNLKKQFTTLLAANLSIEKLKLQAGIQNYTILNYTYFNDSLQVQQAINPLVLLQANVQKDFMYKKWQLQTNAILQPTTSTAPVNLPTVIANINLGYTSYIFKKSLLANIGIQATYNNNFYTPNYNALINSFTYSSAYLQNNLPQLGLFFNGKVKSFRYSLQVLEMQQPINTTDIASAIGKNRMLFANYPAPNLQFKFGFNWVFLN